MPIVLPIYGFVNMPVGRPQIPDGSKGRLFPVASACATMAGMKLITQLKLRYGDFIILALVALLAGGAFWLGAQSRAAGGDAVAEVWQNGKLTRIVRLNELASPVKFALDGAYHNTIEAERGRIRFEDADCPDRVCVHTGWVSKPGQTTACVPNRALIKIVGSAAPEEDVVIR